MDLVGCRDRGREEEEVGAYKEYFTLVVEI